MTSSPSPLAAFGATSPAAREASVRRKIPGSLARYERAQQTLAGGVSTALRRSARPSPLYFDSGAGAVITDVDGNQYLDYTLAWGPLILGHAPEAVNQAVARQLAKGHTFGAQHDLEFEVAELLCRAIPCADLVAFANSGTEIVQVALRLARAATGRTKYLKFEGHYHGWDDSVLVSYRPTRPQIEAAGGQPIPVGVGQRPNHETVAVEWNDREAVTRAFAQQASEIAAVVCEPLLCNSGCVAADPGFLEFLRDITQAHGALLIFDEVITGFRLALGGAQQYYGVTPDLATFAKAAGGGLPLSVLAGKREFMSHIATGQVVHAGTLNGNPLALAAAKATIEELARDDAAAYRQLWSLGETLRLGLQEILQSAGLPVVTAGGGPVFHLSFMDQPARTYRDTLRANTALYSDFGLALLDEGVLVLPDGRWYISTAHTAAQVEQTLEAARRVIG
ncbi:MAG: aspartate aminotransferase family protein [Acidobacteria bacterium]|nr:aspartate aminotransferase family protein [Acidobacteriota bacterium]